MLKFCRSMLTAAGSSRSLRVGATVLGVAAGTVFGEKGADANIMRSLADNPAHIAYGNQFTIAGRQALGLGGGVVSMRITAPGTSLAINWSGTAIANGSTPGSAWILSSNHPRNDFTNAGFGPETITVGTWGNYVTSGETRLTVTQTIPLFGSGSRDPSRPDMCLYYVESGMPQFAQMNLIPISQVSIGSNLEFAGFGQWGYNNQIFPRSGDIRAFVSPLDSQLSVGYDPADYRQTFTLTSDPSPLLGRGVSGYSGCFVGNSLGLTGVGSFGGNGNAFAGPTGFSYLNEARIAEIHSIIPTPGTVAIVAMGALGALRRSRRNGKDA